MASTGQPTGPPPRPSDGTGVEFGAALRALRHWSGLTQRALERAHPALRDATISDHERGARLPRWEWVTLYVTACLHRRLTEATDTQLAAELHHWRTAWTHLHHAETEQRSTGTTAHQPLTDARPPARGYATGQSTRMRVALIIGTPPPTNHHVLTHLRFLGGLAHLLITGEPEIPADAAQHATPTHRPRPAA